jgi:hypothetical protein
MKKTINTIFFLCCLLTVLMLPYFVFAVDKPLDALKKVGTGEGAAGGGTGAGYASYNGDDAFIELAKGTVAPFLGLLGVIFIILIIYGGFLWMTAGGDEERIAKARKTLHRAILGLVILASSFMIWQFITNVLLD